MIISTGALSVSLSGLQPSRDMSAGVAKVCANIRKKQKLQSARTFTDVNWHRVVSPALCGGKKLGRSSSGGFISLLCFTVGTFPRSVPDVHWSSHEQTFLPVKDTQWEQQQQNQHRWCNSLFKVYFGLYRADVYRFNLMKVFVLWNFPQHYLTNISRWIFEMTLTRLKLSQRDPIMLLSSKRIWQFFLKQTNKILQYINLFQKAKLGKKQKFVLASESCDPTWKIMSSNEQWWLWCGGSPVLVQRWCQRQYFCGPYRGLQWGSCTPGKPTLM